jgi:hypothetical protein
LHDVADTSLESLVPLTAVDTDVSGDDAHRDTRGKDIEQRGLSGSGSALVGRRGRSSALSFLCESIQASNIEVELTIKQVSVPGLTQPSTWFRILRSSFLILMS